jgi:hypothetical protein
MTSKLVTFLDEIGQDFKNGLKKLYPLIKEGTALAAAAGPEIAQIDPLFGTVFQTAVAAVSEVEQKFAALGQQSGTGLSKLADATGILEPLVSEALTLVGKVADEAAVQKYINLVVAFLNGIPASAPAPDPAPAPAA